MCMVLKCFSSRCFNIKTKLTPRHLLRAIVSINVKAHEEQTAFRSRLKARIVQLTCLALSIAILAYSNVALVNSSIIVWSEVKRFTGSGTEEYTTAYFSCDRIDWRIRWSYVPDPSNPGYALFNLITYPTVGSGRWVDYVRKIGGSDTHGTSFINNESGTFYCRIAVEETQNYTIIIEQDLNSIPEYQPSLGILILFATTVLMMAYARKRLTKTQEQCAC
jgi:hypothetical protein